MTGTLKPPPEILQLGPFQLLVDKRVLLREGRPVELAPRTVEVLAVLAKQANEIVTKDDLMNAVWPDTFVTEVNLSVHIAALRKFLASAGVPIQIETIPRRGFRLLGEIRAEEVDSDGTTASMGQRTPAIPATQPPWKLGSRRTLIVIALTMGLLVLAGVGLERWANRSQQRVEAGGARIRSLAVLPLQNLSGDPGQDYFAAGITDELTTEVAHIHGLRVISRTSATQFREGHNSLPEIARALDVEGVIEGSVVRAGNRVRITAQLIEGKNDRHLWAGTYEGSIDEVIALQDRVARDISREIRAALNPEAGLAPASRSTTAATVNPMAYDAYLRGLYIWNRRDARTFDKAIEYFSRSVAEDPHFAPAFASLADVYVLWGLNGDTGGMFGPRARQAALQALALDGNSAEAHTALGAVSAVFEWDWATAGREFQRATELDPNYATAHQWYADFYLIPQLRFAEAAAEMDQAVLLDPLSPIMVVDRGWVDYLRGNYPQAKQQYDRALSMDPNFVPALFRLQAWYLMQGRQEEYAQMAGTLARLTSGPDGEARAQAIEASFAQDGIRGVARERLERARNEKSTRWDHGIVAAIMFARLGDSARTCAALHSGVHDREPALLYVNVDPEYAILRASPCYAEVASQIGLPQLPGSTSAATAFARSASPASHPHSAK